MRTYCILNILTASAAHLFSAPSIPQFYCHQYLNHNTKPANNQWLSGFVADFFSGLEKFSCAFFSCFLYLSIFGLTVIMAMHLWAISLDTTKKGGDNYVVVWSDLHNYFDCKFNSSLQDVQDKKITAPPAKSGGCFYSLLKNRKANRLGARRRVTRLLLFPPNTIISASGY